MKIFLLHVRAGQGHQKAAEALYEQFGKKDLGNSKDLRLMDALDYTLFPFGKGYSFFYFLLVKYTPWFWGFLYRLTDRWIPHFLLSSLRSFHNALEARRLERVLIEENPDLIVSTHFFPAEVASRLKKRGRISSRIVVVVTDFLVHRFWVNPGTDFYVGMVEETKEALVQLGVSQEKIFILGIPISERFLVPVDREQVRKQYSLLKSRFTILVTSGSFGSGPIEETVRKMELLGEEIQVLVVCGTNRKLYRELRALQTSFPLVVLGFVDNMHELMEVADVMISRSSGLTTCESLAKGVPMVILSKIPGQESFNADVLRRRGVAFDVSNTDELIELIRHLIQNPSKRDSVREKILDLARPRAAQEIVDLSLRDLQR